MPLVILYAEMDLVLTLDNDVTEFTTAQMEPMRETVVSLEIQETYYDTKEGERICYMCSRETLKFFVFQDVNVVFLGKLFPLF